MKVHIYKAIAILGIFLGLAVAGVRAQAPSRLGINIPFEFSVGKAKLKPGVYTVKRMSGNLIALRSVDDKSGAILNAPVNLSSIDPNSTERLVFNKDGDHYALAQIWLTADTGRQLLKETKTTQPERIEISLRVSKHVD